MNPYREPQKPTSGRLRQFFVDRARRITPLTALLAAVLLAGIALAAVPSMRVNGLKFGTFDESHWITEYGARCDGATDDTTAIQSCLNAVGGTNVQGGTCNIPASASPCMFSNLTMYGRTTLRGGNMFSSVLKRLGGSTGTALREKNNSGEGNPQGGTGLWIRDLTIDGNSTTGDGINVGNQVGGAQLNFLSGLENVYVQNFSGTGIIINQNAAKCSYLWANYNQIGITTSGQGGSYEGIWAEGNSLYNLDTQSLDNSYFHVHLEQDPASHGSITPTAFLYAEGFDNRYFGVDIVMTTNGTNLIVEKAGAAREAFYTAFANPNGHTFTNLIYNTDAAKGTGSTDVSVGFFVDEGARSSYFFDSSTGAIARFKGLGPIDFRAQSSGGSGVLYVNDSAGTNLSYGSNGIASNGTNSTISGPLVLSGAVTDSGAGGVDLSGGTGVFKTPTGAATFGGSSNTFSNKIVPTSDNTNTLGDATTRFNHLYVSAIGAVGVGLDVTSALSTGVPLVVGSNLASAATITPVQPVSHVTGTTTIQTITAPSRYAQAGCGGQIILIFDGVAPWNAAGNIAVAGTPTTAGTAVIFTYDNATSKWYPSRLN